MAEMRRYSVTPQLNIEQILQEAQNRWLRPAEIVEILRNHKNFRIAPEPPHRPPSGSLFLFDRKVLRYFRRDNHNWRKKKDGKTVKEAHEKLKDGSVDVLHCYYAHGEENETFQRRTYWMLDEQYTHIVLVHYLEVKGGKQSYSRLREVESNNSSGPVGSNSFTNNSPSRPLSQFGEVGSPNSAQTSELTETESDNSLRARASTPTSGTGIAGHHTFVEMRQYDAGSMMPNSLFNRPISAAYNHCYTGEANPLTANSDYYGVSQQDISRVFDETGLGFGLTVSGSRATESELAPWDEVLEQSFSNSGYATASTPEESFTAGFNLQENENNGAESASMSQLEDSDIGCLVRSSNSTKTSTDDATYTYSALTKQSSLDLLKIEGDGLKKYDSFSRWMSRELGGAIDELSAKSNSELYWSTVAVDNDVVGESSITISNSENLGTDMLSPSLSQEQLFSIIDFSPSWAYVGNETKVLITGTFLKKKEEVDKCNWSCMFGEVEVPAQILSDGTLRCFVPPHKPGRVPFYVTCSNRTACSEIRDFEFRAPSPFRSDMETSETSPVNNSINEMHLKIRLEKLLAVEPSYVARKSNTSDEICSKIASFLVDDNEWSDLMQLTTDGRDCHQDRHQDRLVEKMLKEKLHSWLVQKVCEEEGGKGANVLGQEGQGVIHLAAALGYDWAMKPIVAAGVSVNFRDVHGWTALHWAASCGRERAVVTLKTLGADPGALSDPTPEFRSGRTPADLASANGHKGIAGFLAESSLTSHLSTLTLKDSKANNTTNNQSEESSSSQEKSEPLKDPLSAVRNATQAAARIYQVFRLQSFQRKKVADFDNVVRGDIDDPLSLVTVKNVNKFNPHEPLHDAAVRIQNKFRGWKGRKEFLIIRQRIVKIQAHVRGHQVRKRYKEIVWTISIVNKLIRWKRKGTGLHRIKSENPSVVTNWPVISTSSSSSSQNNNNNNIESSQRNEDYDDVLKEGRKQTEARLQRALARVKSMVQYPEARDQYRRLIQETQAEERIMQETEEVDGDDFMLGLEDLCEEELSIPSY